MKLKYFICLKFNPLSVTLELENRKLLVWQRVLWQLNTPKFHYLITIYYSKLDLLFLYIADYPIFGKYPSIKKRHRDDNGH